MSERPKSERKRELRAVVVDLHKQAATENSHYYTARVLTMVLDYLDGEDGDDRLWLAGLAMQGLIGSDKWRNPYDNSDIQTLVIFSFAAADAMLKQSSQDSEKQP